MKLTLLKWKYQIIQEPRPFNPLEPWFRIIKVPYGLFSFLFFDKFIDAEYSIEGAEKRVSEILNRGQIETKVIKEYLIEDQSMRNINWKFIDKNEVPEYIKNYDGDFYYDLTLGGYIKPDILKNENQRKILSDAISIIMSFEEAFNNEFNEENNDEEE